MKSFGEAPLTRAELEEHCLSALAAARHACAELAQDLNEATDAELVERAMLARRFLLPAVAMLIPRQPHRQSRALAFWNSVPEAQWPSQGRGYGALMSWLFGYRTVTRADITPASRGD
ncbi:hypothetical protein SAMN04515666_11949 [Bosea lupini]|uniref:Uncharacterized protein n=1 Tax=Bosea lupini TaxID=1036779 RepID=A0A1H8AG57_9HYPH|nr:hypothetical protein [Bosea lupini]SEM69745.1 hypothetical protein SAMN04515666_11949 [Bosea lupini]